MDKIVFGFYLNANDNFSVCVQCKCDKVNELSLSMTEFERLDIVGLSINATYILFG